MKVTLIAILTCAAVLVLHTTAAEELEAESQLMEVGMPDTELAAVDEERLFECSVSCEIEKEGNKDCKKKKCKGGWKCKFNMCVKV
uniref:U4-theraphotoxin-Hhn1a n=1 Tax=Cyriopagopus hainanus TaxID=2781057 RepID=H2A01_CYRHA|nr:RecName: Full=U4-theraphotoxin-Hhn1a; Short=U4-TRTX-Hhn1a; AltName: Full=Hainantoxin-II; Short=HNTX-II; AltName: Full=Peptide F8-20.15; Flags: Precursor [Haplopelma hainanum]ADB56697.1 HNTX-II precursor [Haplopelma hainanum]ADB56881.1 HNTX-II precursor [Haplopelma hainanum]